MFPDFLPAYDAMASLCKLLELLAPVEQPLSTLVAELPASTLVHRQLPCPWAQKGLVMRVLSERLKGRDVDLLDGIKVSDRRGWVQVLPDPDEPLVHIYAEGRDEQDVERARERVPGARRRGAAGPRPESQAEVEPLECYCFTSQRRRTPNERLIAWNRFPICPQLSDADLKKLIDDLTEEEQEISYRRRLLHGKIDILRAELVARLQKPGSKGVLEQVDVDRLATILAGKAVAARRGTTLEPRLLPGVRLPEPRGRELLREVRRAARP